MREITCSECGRQYRTSNNSKKTLCPTCRKPKGLGVKKCPCGTVFTPARSNQKYCCKRCKDAQTVHADTFTKVCALLSCQKEFEGTHQRRYCSKECSENAHRGAYMNIRHKGPEDYVR